MYPEKLVRQRRVADETEEQKRRRLALSFPAPPELPPPLARPLNMGSAVLPQGMPQSEQPVLTSSIPVTDMLHALRDPGFERFYRGLNPSPQTPASTPPPIAAPLASPLNMNSGPQGMPQQGQQPVPPVADKLLAGGINLPRLGDAPDLSAVPPPSERTMAVPAGPLKSISIPPTYSTEGMNPLQRSMLKLNAMQTAGPRDEIEETSAGIDVVPKMGHMNRGKAALEGAGMGLLRGGLPGALFGLGMGAISPQMIEKLNQQRRVAGQENIVNSQVEQQGNLAKLGGLQSEIGLRNAQRDKLLRPPVMKPQYVKDGRGRLFSVDPQDPTQVTAVTDENGKVLDPKFERPYTIPQVSPDGVSVGLLQYDATTDSYKPVVSGGQPVVTKRVEKVETEGPNAGEKVSTVANRTATNTRASAGLAVRQSEGEKNRSAANQRNNNTIASEDRRAAMRGGGRADKSYEEAQRLIDRFNQLTVEAAKAKPSRQSSILGARDAVEANIKSRFGPLVELDDKGKPTRLKARPGPPASSPGPRLTEQQVRDHAIQNHLDPDKLVERARKNGDLQ
jgi:hypothetical protein